MQFRERSKVIQVIRTVYDPALKRGRAELVARLDKQAPELDEYTRNACSPAEIAEIEAFIANRAAMLSLDAKRAATAGLAAQMRLAEAYFRSAPTHADGVIAADILAAWTDLKKAMRKAGFRGPKDET